MSIHAKRRFPLLLFVPVLAIVAAACSAAPAADAPPSEAISPGAATQPAGQAAREGAAQNPVVTEATPLPELRTNAAGAVLVSQDELLRMIDAGTAPMILDVRTPEEFAAGHVPGAINISHDELAARLAEVEAVKGAGVVVYCRSGRRAGIAEELLIGRGFSNVQHLEGDMLAWLEADRPTQKQQ